MAASWAFTAATRFADVIGQFKQDRLVAYTAWRLAPSAYGPAWELLALERPGWLIGLSDWFDLV